MFRLFLTARILKFFRLQPIFSLGKPARKGENKMVAKLHRTYYRNKKHVRRMYFGLVLAIGVFVLSPGWVYLKAWHI